MRRSEVTAAEAVSCLNKALIRLKDVWEEIGIPEQQRLERTRTVKTHIQDLLEMMVAEEESLKLRLEKSVESSCNKIQVLSLELDLPQPQMEPKPLLQAEEDLRSRLELLLKEKSRRVEQLQALLLQDQQLATKLGTPAFTIDQTCTPSLRQLDELQQHLVNKRGEQAQREVQFLSLREQVLVLILDLDHSLETGLEKDLVQSDLKESSLSLQRLETLELLLCQLQQQHVKLEEQGRLIQDQILTLWNQLDIPQTQRDDFKEKLQLEKTRRRIELLQEEVERLEQVKLSNIRSMGDRVRAEISEFWDKCFSSDETRLGLTVFYNDQVSEQILEVLELELQRLKQFYDDHRPIMEGIQRWIDQWEQLVELERKASDPSRFTNRGGNLLREERQRKELSKSLSKLERVLQTQISLWEQTRLRPVRVKGLDFKQFAEKQWNKLHQQKEREKNLRHLRKARQMEEDMMFGTTHRSPTKRRFISAISPNRGQTRGPSPSCHSQGARGHIKAMRTLVSGCSVSTNSTAGSVTPGPRPPHSPRLRPPHSPRLRPPHSPRLRHLQVPLVQTPVRSKPPQPRVPVLNQDQTRTKARLNQDHVWTQGQKENRRPAQTECESLNSVVSTYSHFLRDLSESKGQVQNQVFNSTDL